MASQEAYDLLGEIKIDKSPVASERKEAQGILDEIKLDRQNPTAFSIPSIKSPVPEQRSFARRILDAVMYSDNPPGPGEVPQDQTTQLGVMPPHSSALDPAKKFLFDAPAEAAANIRENPTLSMVTLGKGLAGQGELTPEEASKASNTGISEQEILDEARKTGQVPYGKILANRLQSEAAGFVPLTPIEVAIAESIPKVLEGAAIGLQRVLPEWASKPILSTLKDWAAKKEIKVPLTNEDIRNFYTFGKEKLDPRTYDILQSIDPEILKKAAKSGEGVEAKVKVPRFGGGNVPQETIPKGVDKQIDSGFNPDLAREMAAPTPAAHSPSLAREIVEMPTPKEFQTPEAIPNQPTETNIIPQKPTSAEVPPTSPKTTELKVFQGTGRPDAGSVYTFKGAEPLLGKDAEYYALDQQTARKFGPDIKQHTVKLDNPLVINSPDDWAKLTRSVGIYPDFLTRAETSKGDLKPFYADRDKVLAQIKKLGHDGVIVSPSAIEANGHRNPVARLFGDAQIVKFKTSPKTNEGVTQSLQSTQGMSAEKWGVDLPSEPTGDVKPVSRLEMVKHMERAYKAPVKGRVTFRMGGGEQGHYSPLSEHVRLKNWGEVEVLAHEAAGHAMDGILKKKHGTKWKLEIIPKELQGKARQELGALDYNQRKKRLSEGFAEYMRHWITLGDEDTFAPTWGPKFKEWLAKNEPEFMKSVAEQKAMYQRYKDQGAVERIIQHMDFTGKLPKSARPTFGEKVSEDLTQFKARWVDEFYPIERAERVLGISDKSPTRSAFQMATYSKMKSSAVARAFVEEGAMDEFGNKVGKSLKEILKNIIPEDAWTAKTYMDDVLKNGPLFRRMKEFMAYGVAKRAAIDLRLRKIESGVDMKDAEYVIRKFRNDKWDQALAEMEQWMDHGLDWLVRAGSLGPQERDLMRMMNPNYLIFKRAFYDEFAKKPGGMGKGMMGGGKGVSKMHGSARPLINPAEAMISQMTSMIQKAMKARVAGLITEWTKVPGHGKFIAEIPAPKESTIFTLEQIRSQLGKMGIDTKDADLKTLMQVFTRASDYQGKENVVSVWKDGQRKWYELSTEMYKALQGVDDLVLDSRIMRGLSAFARVQRLGATQLKASFGLIKNPVRDILTYAVFSKGNSGIQGLTAPIQGILHDLTNTEGAKRFKHSGGEMSHIIGWDRESTMRVYDTMLLDMLPHGGTLKVVKDPLNAIRQIFSIPEMGPRIAEYEAMMKKLKAQHPDWTDEDVHVAAFNAAQDVTVNFTRSGSVGKKLNTVSAFLTAQIGSIDKLFREANGNPANFVLRGMLYLTPIALWSWWHNRDKSWYKNLEPSYKYGNMFFQVGNDVIRLPFPFELGTIFMGLPMAILDAAHEKDPALFKEFGKSLANYLPMPIPTAFSPVVDVMRNKDWIGRPIESEGMKRLPTQQRYRYYTSEIAKKLSQGFGAMGFEISPVQIDYLIWNYSGGIPGQFRSYGGIHELGDVWVIGDVVVRTPEKPSRQLNQFFDEYTRLSQKMSAARIRDNSGLTAQDYLREKQLEAFRTQIYVPFNEAIEKAAEAKDVKRVRQLYGKLGEAFEKTGIMDYARRSK